MRVELHEAEADYGQLLASLERERWVAQIRIVRGCASTNPAALDLSERGSPAVVVAETQTEGRGRRGTRWKDVLGASALCSIAWRPAKVEREAFGLLSLAAGVAAALTCRDLGAADAGVKWPNDVWSRGRKMGGVLTETRLAGQRTLAIVSGIGINVVATPDSGPPQAFQATCLQAEGAPSALPPAVIAGALEWLSRLISPEGRPDSEAVLRCFAQTDLLRGRPMEATVSGETVRGVAAGVDSEGRLLVRDEMGGARALPTAALKVRPLD
jgi:BirA family biotin operon repressor/biotin-[acetyl-CoA-carboxylase] ligase